MTTRGHPKLHEAAESPEDESAMVAFADDLALLLLGAPPESLQPLARVIAAVARKELADARALCEGRPVLAGEAAVRATIALWPWLRELEGGEGDGEPDPGDGGDGDGDEEGEEGGASGDDDGDGPGAQQLREAATAAVDGALAADRTMRHLERLLPGVGWSLAPGALEERLAPHLTELSRLAERLPELRSLADALGRMEAAARRSGSEYGGSEQVVGVHLGGSVADALPMELALLGDEDTEDLFYQRLTERRLLSLELVGAGLDGSSAADRKGPVILAVDTSGSMLGDPELLAKALVLAIARRAVSQGRVAHLLLFGGPAETVEIRIARGALAAEGVLAFLGRAFGAGTDFDTPLLRAVELLSERALARADVVVVTDGLGRANPDVIEVVARARRDGVRFYAAVVGAMSVDGVRPFADEVFAVHGDALDGAGMLLMKL